MAAEQRLMGSVVRLVELGGFGFIQTPDGTDYFFHRSAIADYQLLTRGCVVTFTPTSTAKGPRAENVERVERA